MVNPAQTVPEWLPIEVLRNRLHRVCGDFAIEPVRKGRADLQAGAVRTCDLGRFDAAQVTLNIDHVTRDRQAIRRDPGEYMFLLIQQDGEAVIEQDGRVALLHAGEMCLVDSTRPSRFRHGRGLSHQLSLHMPRDEMIHRFGNRCAEGFTVLRDDPLFAPISAVVGRMADADPFEGAGLSEALLGLMGAWFAARNHGNHGDATVSRAMRLIESRAADPGFGPGQLAAEMNVSERVLQRHFRAIGTTPGRAIIELRLTRAMSRLRSGSEPIISIAYSCGFNDLSYFYREFRRRYGQPPGAVQRRAVSDLSKN